MVTQIILLDTSSSMGSAFFGDSLNKTTKFKAAIRFIENILDELGTDCELILISFESAAKIVFEGIAGNIKQIKKKLHKLKPNGGTSIKDAFDLIGSYKNRQYLNSKFQILTDGELSTDDDTLRSAQKIKSKGAFLDFCLLDTSKSAIEAANKIVGEDGAGSVVFAGSSDELIEQQAESIRKEKEEIERIKKFEREYELEKKELNKELKDSYNPFVTVSYPKQVSSLKWNSILFFIYKAEYFHRVNTEISLKAPTTEDNFNQLTERLVYRLVEGCKITVIFRSSDFQFNQSKFEIKWFEGYQKSEVRFMYNSEVSTVIYGEILIDLFIEKLFVSSLKLNIQVINDEKSAHAQVNQVENLKFFEEVFASYSRDDFEIVNDYKEKYRALGIHLFVDLFDLQSGVQWRIKLFEQIDSSDVFQLFWSNSAKKSNYVELEWRRALGISPKKVEGFIKPLYWVNPIPAVPVELSDINFLKVDINTSKYENRKKKRRELKQNTDALLNKLETLQYFDNNKLNYKIEFESLYHFLNEYLHSTIKLKQVIPDSNQLANYVYKNIDYGSILSDLIPFYELYNKVQFGKYIPTSNEILEIIDYLKEIIEIIDSR